MYFNSIEFIAYFLPVILAGFFLASRFGRVSLAIGILVVGSLFFYGWWKPEYLILLVFSLLFNFAVARQLLRLPVKAVAAKWLLGFGVGVNLAMIGYYKYTNFAIDIVNDVAGTDYGFLPLLLPLGISFFTFQQVAFLVDSYQRKTTESRFLHYCLFVTFFPQLIAGPIVHHSHVMGQFEKAETFRFKLENLNLGLFIFTIGLMKKALLADNVAAFASPIFMAADGGQVISTLEAWGGALAYTTQLYFDFSGYSDMAIGLGLMFGIRLPINFASPYKAVNITEFWRRWHITLSNFLRDYIYIPLGGSRCGQSRRYGNLMATMLIGGLWHGAGWNFILWGGLHGAYLVINHGWQALTASYRARLDTKFCAIAGITLTFLLVMFSWVFFRAVTFDGAVSMIQSMLLMHQGLTVPEDLAATLTRFGGSLSFATAPTVIAVSEWFYAGVPLIGLLLGLAFFAPNAYQMMERLKFAEGRDWVIDASSMGSRKGLTIALLAGMGFFVALTTILAEQPSEFLYFNF